MGCCADDAVNRRGLIAWVLSLCAAQAACCACRALWSWVYQWTFHKLMSPLVAAEILVSTKQMERYLGALLMML
jgi:hypothetical protein